jgi:F-type H+-transporting ATPase subunit delta
MSKIVDKYAAVARVWGKALMSVAEEAGRADQVRDELRELVALLDAEPRLDQLLASPLIDDESKRVLLEKTLRGRASDLVVDTLQVMRRKGRLGLVRIVAIAFEEDWMRRRNHIEVYVRSAVPLDEPLRAELRLAAAERTNRHPILVERVEPGLLGGMVVEIGDERIDSSIRRELERMEESLLARASRELVSGKSYVIENS